MMGDYVNFVCRLISDDMRKSDHAIITSIPSDALEILAPQIENIVTSLGPMADVNMQELDAAIDTHDPRYVNQLRAFHSFILLLLLYSVFFLALLCLNL